MSKSAPLHVESFPFIVMGNKVDLDSDRVVSEEEAQAFRNEHGAMMFCETSAKDNLNVDDGFRELAMGAIKR